MRYIIPSFLFILQVDMKNVKGPDGIWVVLWTDKGEMVDAKMKHFLILDKDE